MVALRERERAMTSKFRALTLGLLLLACLPAAMARGPYGGYRGGYYRGGDYWLGPALIGGAIVGTSIYLSRPVQPSTVIITSPPAVVVTTPVPATTWVNGQQMAAPVESYYCRDSGQYFPVVQTCTSPWLVVITQ